MSYRREGLLFAIGMSLLLGAPACVNAQGAAGAPHDPLHVTVNDEALKRAGSKGFPMPVVSNVSDQTSVEAVLIPATIGRRIFGSEVAKNYAIVEVIISNRDPNAALIVHSVFLDYSQWLLSGIAGASVNSSPFTPSQSVNQAGQVASVESRLVRDELLDAQPDTARNWTMRGMTALGSVGTGFGFPFTTDVIKGIGVFTGVVVPGAATLWPDSTISQLNHISDVGFRTNMIIPKQASDILVAFFPIDRFLTPTFHKLFVTNPAGFFVPGELLADPKLMKDKTSKAILDVILPLAQRILKDDGQGDQKAKTVDLLAYLVKAAHTDCLTKIDEQPGTLKVPIDKAGEPSDETLCQLKDLVIGLSLNSVRVVVGGVMSVDVAAVPATIRDVTFDAGNTAALWTTTSTARTGVIHGVYVGGGVPAIVDEKGLPIPGISIKATADGATDTELPFTMMIADCVTADKVYFVVNKSPDTAGSTASSTNNTAQAKSSSSKVSANVASMPFEVAPAPHTCPSSSK